MAPRPSRAPRGLVVGGLLVAVLYVISPMRIVGDSQLVFADARSLLHDGDLDLSEYAEVPAVAGEYAYVRTADGAFDYFPWMSALLALPVVASIDAAHAVGVGDGADALIRSGAPGLADVQELIASMIAAATAVLLGLAGMRLWRGVQATRGSTIELGWRVEALVVVAVGLATPLWSTTSRALWQHTSADLALAGALAAATFAVDGVSPSGAPPRRPTLAAATAAALLVVGLWSRPAAGGVVAVLLVGLLVAVGPRARLAVVAAATSSVALLVAANVVLLGTWRPLYLGGGDLGPNPDLTSSRLSLHRSYLDAIAANLVSPARGALVFSSVVAAGVLLAWRCGGSLRRWAVISTLAFVAALAVVSAYGSLWWAGVSYGPRFMIEGLVVAVPVAVAGLVERFATWRPGVRVRPAMAVAAVLLAASVGLHGIGAWSESAWEWNRVPEDLDHHTGRVWDWTDPPFLRPFGFGDAQ